MMASLVSGRPIFAPGPTHTFNKYPILFCQVDDVLPAMRISQDNAISNPPPKAAPSIAAIVGIGSVYNIVILNIQYIKSFFSYYLPQGRDKLDEVNARIE